MKNVPSSRVRPTNSQEDRRSLFPFAVSLPRLRFAAARQILSIGIALALLILSIPNASAQQNPARNPDKDIAASGLGLSNKNARGIWVDEGKQVMLVLDAHGQHKKIFSYCMETKRRLDNHHKDGEVTSNPDADDFYLYSAGTTQLPNPYGIWSDGTTLWVSNFGQKDPDTKNFDGPKAIKPQIYAYTITWADSPIDSSKKYAKKGTRVSGQDFNPQTLITAGNEKPHGIWVHSEIMWVADNGADKIFAYNWPSKTRNSSKDIDLTHDDAYAQGIWSNGTTMWVANIAGSDPDDEQIIYAYDIASKAKARDPRKDYTALSAAGNDRPRGIWSDGTTMWVADQTDNKIYAYNLPVPPNRALDFDTLKDAKNIKPKGMWSDGETMWVADANINKAKLYAYDFFTKEQLPDKEFDTLVAAENHDPTGIWSDGTTMWVADYEDDKLYAYNMSDKTRDVDNDFNTLTAAGNNQPTGIWSDGTTMWVADTEDDKVYAYKMADKSPDSTKDINVKALIGNPYPRGIWSDGTTMWVTNLLKAESNEAESNEAESKEVESKIHAFTLPVDVEDENGVKSVRAASRVEAKDLPVLALENKNAFGLWSDETTMWVTDDVTSKIYAYRLSDAASLGELKITGHIPSPEYEDFDVDLKINDEPKPFNSGITRYTASVPYATERLTIAPTTLRTDDVSSISPADTDTTDTENGHQVNLAVGENTISITVANADTNTASRPQTRTYTVVVTREFFTFNDPSKDVSLSTNWIPANVDVRGLWTDGATMWLSAQETTTTQGQNEEESTTTYSGRLYSYNLQSTNLVVSTNNLTHNNPYGIWSDGTTMWIADDSNDDKLYAYGLESGDRLNSTNDFALIEGNDNPQWIWSDGITMWVTDHGDNTIYAYGMSNKLPDPTKNINIANVDTATANRVGLWSDGATLWIADKEDAKMYAYKLKTDESSIKIHCPDATEDFNTLEAAKNHNPKAIFSDGSTMWVVDNTAKKIFAYNQPLSANNNLKRLELSNVYSESTSMLIEEVFSSVTNNYSAYVFYTSLSTTVTAIAQDPDAGVSIQPKDADPATPGHQVHLSTGHPTRIVITVTAENAAVNKYIVNVTRRYNDGRLPFRDFNFLTMGNTDANPTGLWSDGTNMWVLDKMDKKFYVYKMTDLEWGRRDGDKGFELEMSNSAPGDIWSTNGIMWVPNKGSGKAGKIYAYDLNASANHYHSSEDFNALYSLSSTTTNTSARGLWSDGTTMWVVDDGYKGKVGNVSAQKIFAYNLNLGETNKTRVADKEFTLSVDNESPWGIWSNGTNMWILDRDDKKLYAYEMLGENRGDPAPSKNIDLLKDIALNGEGEMVKSRLGDPRGIWSNGEIMWVSNSADNDRKIYAYDMNAEVSGNSDVSNDSTLSVLRLSGIGLNPAFSPDKEIYTALVDHTVNTTTVTAAPNDSEATVNIFSGTHGTTRSTASRGPQVSLQEGYNIIAIDVTAENGISRSTYLIDVTKSEAPPVSGGPLPQPQSFQPSATSSANQTDLASSAIGIGEWQSRLIFAEPLLNGGVRFVFLVSAEELKIETTPDLLGETWRPLPDDEFKAVRESNGNGQDQLTVILPQTEGKQRFLRLTPQR